MPCICRDVPGPVRGDTEQSVKRLGGIAATKHHSFALQADHTVPVAGSWRGAHHAQAVPGERHSIQYKNVVHEAASSFGVTAPKHQHEVGTPHGS